MKMLKLAFAIAPLLYLIMARSTSAEPASQDAAEVRETAAAVDLRITVEGGAAVPENSRVELRGIDPCDAAATSSINAEGQAKFSRVPLCKVVFKILIPGLETGIVQVDLAKYKGELIRIHMQSSGPAKATVLNP